MPPILPRGVGKSASRQSFNSWLKEVANHFQEQVEVVYVREMEILLNDIIQHTPIATGAAAGVESNLVGETHVIMTDKHPGYGLSIGNGPGESGWQLEVEQTKNKLNMSITNPMWEPYLQYLEYGIVQPSDPRASSHFVHNAWSKHLDRREKLSAEIANA